MEVVAYGGWPRCARYVFAGLELIVTLDVGPRIIRFGVEGGTNELKEYEKHSGATGGLEYRSYGGHRLWRAPEDPVLTMQPDNDPVEISRDGDYDLFRSKTDRFSLQKEVGVRILEASGAVSLRHRIHNRGSDSVTLAPWAITVMAPGGECFAPMAPYQAHSDNLLPVRPLVLWGYTDLEDQRFSLGPGVLRLRQSPAGPNQKIGMPVDQGYAAHVNGDRLFIKRFPWDRHASYPDMGCNFEAFTREDMLEVESLGPLQEVAPGAFAEHQETWYLVTSATPPKSTRDVGPWLEALCRTRPLV